MEGIGKRLKELRKALRLSQREFGEKESSLFLKLVYGYGTFLLSNSYR